MIATAASIKEVRKSFRPADGAGVYMTAREFAQVPHSLDKRMSDWAYTPNGEKWGWSDIANVWVRICWSGYEAMYKKNGR